MCRTDIFPVTVVDNKRLHDRFDLPIEVDVEQFQGFSKNIKKILLSNIGVGGACFIMKDPVLIGSELNMQLHDEGSRFASSLGLETSNTGALRFRMDCRVLRVEQDPDDNESFLVSVEFIRPIQIIEPPLNVK